MSDDGVGLPAEIREEGAGPPARLKRRAPAGRAVYRQARQAYAAIDGWTGVNTPADWVRVCRKAEREYGTGRFLLEQLGAERLMDPVLMATLWGLRQRLIEEFGVATAAEAMLVDMTVLNYAMALRLNGMIGNAALTIEHQFFGDEQSPDVRFRTKHGSEVAERLSVEYTVERLRLQLMPLFDRANRGLIRNLQALRDVGQPPAPPPVAIGRADQVNVGGQQINVAQPPDGAV